MAVKVISLSKKEVTCHSCKSVLEYVYYDTREVRHTDYGGGTDTYRGIDCPVCKSFVETK
jgi:hypothetical protein